MRKEIKIFLGSSIVEFERERETIENFIYRISRNFEKNYNVSVEPLLCENFDDAYSKIRKQEEYNEKVKESDLCFFIFFTKAGKYTREEFEVARRQFEESGKPKIYTYFKVLGDEKAEDSLYDFMNELDKVFGHYYGSFEHIDTIKLRILLNLKLQEMDFLEIKADGDDCLVDGVKTLSLKNVSEFANNSIFNELKNELQSVEQKYFTLKAKYVSGECSDSEEREYIEIATKRKTLIDAVEEMQKNIFNMSLRMCQDEARGEITQRQKEAYRLFEAGDLEGANRILDFAEIKNDYQRRKAIREAEQRKDAQIFIREGRTKIDILTVMSSLSTRFEEIEEIYDEITEVAMEEQIEVDTVIDYVWFLYEQNKHQKAYDIATRIRELVTDSSDDEKKADIYHTLGTICSGFASKKAEAEEYYKKAIAIREKLAGTNPERFNPALADSYNNVGIFYDVHGRSEKSEKYYKKTIAIRKKLAEINPYRFSDALAVCYNNVGNFYERQGKSEKTEEFYKKAIKIREKIADLNPEKFNPALAASYNNAGVFYENQGQAETARSFYEKSIAIFKELAETNPEKFNANLATSYNNAGNFYDNQRQSKKAEDFYKKSISICEKFAKISPERFMPDLADNYNNIAIFYKNKDRLKKAEVFYKKSVEIYEILAEINPDRYNEVLAICYNNIGIFYKIRRQPEKAKVFYKKSIELFEKLSEINPGRFNADLAMSYNNIGVLYKTQRQVDKAVEYYKKAIAIREKLAETNFRRFNPDLAASYYNYAVILRDKTYFRKALEVAKTCPEDENCKKIISLLSQ